MKFAPLLAIMNSDILPLRSYFCGFDDLEVFMSLKRGSEPQAAFNGSTCRDSGRTQREVRKADAKKPSSFLACLGLGAAFPSFTHQIPRSAHHFGHCRSLGDMLMGIVMGPWKRKQCERLCYRRTQSPTLGTQRSSRKASQEKQNSRPRPEV